MLLSETGNSVFSLSRFVGRFSSFSISREVEDVEPDPEKVGDKGRQIVVSTVTGSASRIIKRVGYQWDLILCPALGAVDFSIVMDTSPVSFQILKISTMATLYVVILSDSTSPETAAIL